jgi:hypothetical protein
MNRSMFSLQLRHFVDAAVTHFVAAPHAREMWTSARQTLEEEIAALPRSRPDRVESSTSRRTDVGNNCNSNNLNKGSRAGLSEGQVSELQEEAEEVRPALEARLAEMRRLEELLEQWERTQWERTGA